MKNNFFVFEGVDGTGKSTCIKLVADELRSIGFKVAVVREPGGSKISEHIRSLLVNGFPLTEEEPNDLTNALLFNASRSELVNKTIIPKLEEGYIVLADRFVDSTLVYQGYCKGNVDRDGEIKKLMDLHDVAIGIRPNITYLFECAPKTAYHRTVGRGLTNKLDATNIELVEERMRGYRRVVELKEKSNRYVTVDNDSNSPESVIGGIVGSIEKAVCKNNENSLKDIEVRDILTRDGLFDELKIMLTNSDRLVLKEYLTNEDNTLNPNNVSKVEELGFGVYCNYPTNGGGSGVGKLREPVLGLVVNGIGGSGWGKSASDLF